MNLRVAHIIGGLRIGGAERNLVNVLNSMQCEYRGAVFVGEEAKGPSFHHDLDRSIEQHYLRIRRRNMPLGIVRLAGLLRKKRINVVHTHMYYPSLYGAIAASLIKVPVVVTTEHGENPWKRNFQRWIERNVVSPLVDLRFCVSPQILTVRREMDRIPAEKLQLIVNGTVVPRATMRAVNREKPVIGAVGRFVPAKDYPTLLAAAEELKRDGYNFELIILGDGPEKHKIEAVIEQLHLTDVTHLPGMVADVGSWYKRFDIYASSSIREGQPVALLEAMAHGLPTVSTDVGSASATVDDGKCGIIVPAEEPGAMAAALARLLDDVELRKALGEKARRKIESDFSVGAVARIHVEAYKKILRSKSQ